MTQYLQSLELKVVQKKAIVDIINAEIVNNTGDVNDPEMIELWEQLKVAKLNYVAAEKDRYIAEDCLLDSR